MVFLYGGFFFFFSKSCTEVLASVFLSVQTFVSC